MRSNIKGVAPEWYVLRLERDEPEPVSFFIRPLDGFGWTEVMGASYDPVSGSVGMAGIRKAFQIGVRDWRNIEDADHPGQPLIYSQKAMPSIPPAWIIEVGTRILEISRLDGEQAKNSDSPSSSPAPERTSPVSAGDAIVPKGDGEAATAG